MRDSFLFYRSFFESINELKDKEQLAVYKALMEYALNGEKAELKGIPSAIFALIKPQIDANQKKYEAGKKGGAPKGNQNAKKTIKGEEEKQPKTTNDCFKNKQKQPNVNANANANANENANVNENENANANALKEKHGESIKKHGVAEPLFSPLLNFCLMRDEIKKPIPDKGIEIVLKKLNSLATEESDKIKILEQSTLNRWIDIYPIKVSNNDIMEKRVDDVDWEEFYEN